MATTDGSLATGLTNEQRIQEFQSVTLLDDEVFCRECLEKNQWNVEQAVNVFFSSSGSRRPKPTSSSSLDDSWFNYFRQVTRDSIGEESYIGGYLALPLIDLSELVLGGIWTVTSFIGGFIFPATAENNHQIRNQLLSPDQSIIPVLHSQSQLPPWFLTGSLQEAIAESRMQSKLLFLILHEDGNPLSQRYIDDTLQNDAVVSFLIHNLVCWGAKSTSRSARALQQQMRNSPGTYPISSLYRARDRDLQLLWKYDGFIDTDALIAFLMQGLERVQYAQDQMNTTNLRQVQDVEYEELVARHQQEQREHETDPEEITPMATPETIHEPEPSISKELEQQRTECAALLPEEPGEDIPNRIQFRFRLPDGTNLTRHYLPTHSVLDLKSFVCSLDLRSTNEEVVESFELFTPFPRKVYENDDETIQSAFGSAKRVNLVVKEIF